MAVTGMSGVGDCEAGISKDIGISSGGRGVFSGAGTAWADILKEFNLSDITQGVGEEF